MKLVIVICVAATSAVMGSLEHNNYIDYAPHFTHAGINYGISGFGNLFYPKNFNFLNDETFGHEYILGLNGFNKHFLTSFQKVPELLHVSDSIANNLESNILDLPKIVPNVKNSVRYTNTPTNTYEVKEDNYDPVPVPILENLNSFLPTQTLNIKSQPTTIGSGSLGVAYFGDGKFALGSGSLGISGNIVKAPEVQFKGPKGGLYEVPAPNLGSPPTDYSAFARNKDQILPKELSKAQYITSSFKSPPITSHL